jgi:hypothetical protein
MIPGQILNAVLSFRGRTEQNRSSGSDLNTEPLGYEAGPLR